MMEKQQEQIELRSEKVRHIIGNELPFWVRHGITVVTVMLALAATGIWIIWNEI